MSAGLNPVLRWAKLFGGGKGSGRELVLGRAFCFCLCLATSKERMWSETGGEAGEGAGCSRGCWVSGTGSWGTPTTVTTRRFLGGSWSSCFVWGTEESSRVRLRGADIPLKA